MADKDHQVVGFHHQGDQYGGSVAYPLITDIVDESLCACLTKAGLKQDDAMHLMYAQHNGFGYFLTCDNGLLCRCQEIKKKCRKLSIEIPKPSEFVSALQHLPPR